jgi:hypothetical protein
MPVGLVRQYQNNWFGNPGQTGLNEQIGLWAVNNSGQFLAHGDVVVWDTTATNPPATTNTTINGTITLTQASQTITVVSTTGFASAGNILVMATIVGTPSATSTVPVNVSYTGKTATTFTGAQASVASVTNGLVTGAQVTIPPVLPLQSGTPAVPPYSPAEGLPPLTVATDAGRYITLAQLAASPLVAGVVSLTGDAGTATIGPMTDANAFGVAGGQVPANWAGASIAQPVVPPGGAVFVVVSGIARVQIGGNTVAALGIVGTDVIPRQGATTATLGNVLGIALEAQSAKDANNTIRCAIKVG